MCGIAGGLTQSGISTSTLNIALDALRHRGPDDCGIFRQRSVALGMRRLAIIDVAHGQQPISNEDGSAVVVFNGEIYNYVELMRELKSRGHQFRTASDTETLVHLYEEYGPAMCSRLRGMFAFAIWDERKQSLFIARDRFGKKPLYFARTMDDGIVPCWQKRGLAKRLILRRSTTTSRWVRFLNHPRSTAMWNVFRREVGYRSRPLEFAKSATGVSIKRSLSVNSLIQKRRNGHVNWSPMPFVSACGATSRSESFCQEDSIRL